MKINEEVSFLPDSDGKKCVVPDLQSLFSEELLAKANFKYFIIRQTTEDGNPTGLYLKDVSKFRNENQNAISKYKFQTPFTSNPLDDKLLVKLRPNDVFDLPEYTKNQKEYACFENFLNGKAELVAVFESKSLNEIIDPIGFKMKFVKNNGEQIEIIPTIQKDYKLKFADIQKELDEKFNTIPDDNNTTQYLFCDNLSCVIYKSEFKNSASIKKTENGVQYPYDFYIEVVDSDVINNIISEKKHRVDTRTEQCKVSEYFSNNSFLIKNSNFPEGIKIKYSQIFFDEECTIPVTKKHNFSADMDHSTLYTKKEYVVFSNNSIIIKTGYKYYDKISVGLIFKNGTFGCDVSDIKTDISDAFGISFDKVTITTSSGPVSEFLNYEQILSEDYKIEISHPRTVVIDGHTLNFDFNTEGKGYCADITSIIEEQKKQNSVYHFFAEGGTGIYDYDYDVDYRYVMEVVQYTKDKIFARVLDGFSYGNFETYTLDNFEKYINNIQKRVFSGNDLTVYVKKSRYSSGSYNMEKRYDLSCQIEAVFSGVSRLYPSDYYLYPKECSWYATKLNLTEIQKTYPNITEEYVTLEALLPGDVFNYETVVDRDSDLYINRFETSNKPDYKPFFNKRDDEYYIPEHIKNQSGMPLIFTSFEDTRRWYLALYKGGL